MGLAKRRGQNGARRRLQLGHRSSFGTGACFVKTLPQYEPRFAAEQFHAQNWPNNATILSPIDGFGCGREREWGHRRKRAGSTRRTHPCTFTSLAMTRSRCARAAGHDRQGRDCCCFEGGVARRSAQRQAPPGAVECAPRVEQQAKLCDRNTLSIDCGQRPRRRPTPAKIYRANCTRIVTGAYGEPRNAKSRRELRG